jgi:hypothetical protein
MGSTPIQQLTIAWGSYLDGHEYEFGPEDYDGIDGDDDEGKIEKLRNSAFSAASRNGKHAVTHKVTIEKGKHKGRRALHVQFFPLGQKPAKQSARRVG